MTSFLPFFLFFFDPFELNAPPFALYDLTEQNQFDARCILMVWIVLSCLRASSADSVDRVPHLTRRSNEHLGRHPRK